MGRLVWPLQGVRRGEDTGPSAVHVKIWSALVGPLSRVDDLVLDEVRALAEALPTLHARVGLLPSVDFLVVNEVGAAVEGFTALVTLVGLQAIVDSLVLDKR